MFRPFESWLHGGALRRSLSTEVKRAIRLYPAFPVTFLFNRGKHPFLFVGAEIRSGLSNSLEKALKCWMPSFAQEHSTMLGLTLAYKLQCMNAPELASRQAS